MRFLTVAFVVLLLTSVSFTQELHRAKTLFTANTFKFIYSHEDETLSFKDLKGQDLGSYRSQLGLSLLQDSKETKYNTVLEHKGSEVLITQWENGKFFVIRAFIPSTQRSNEPYCEINIEGEPFNWRTDKNRVSVEKPNNHLQLKFTRQSGNVEICK